MRLKYFSQEILLIFRKYVNFVLQLFLFLILFSRLHSSSQISPLSRERSSTGSNDCFVVLVVVVFVPCCGTFCSFPWHISLFVPSSNQKCLTISS
jgi:hypothetical protein